MECDLLPSQCDTCTLLRRRLANLRDSHLSLDLLPWPGSLLPSQDPRLSSRSDPIWSASNWSASDSCRSRNRWRDSDSCKTSSWSDRDSSRSRSTDSDSRSRRDSDSCSNSSNSRNSSASKSSNAKSCSVNRSLNDSRSYSVSRTSRDKIFNEVPTHLTCLRCRTRLHHSRALPLGFLCRPSTLTHPTGLGRHCRPCRFCSGLRRRRRSRRFSMAIQSRVEDVLEESPCRLSMPWRVLLRVLPARPALPALPELLQACILHDSSHPQDLIHLIGSREGRGGHEGRKDSMDKACLFICII